MSYNLKYTGSQLEGKLDKIDVIEQTANNAATPASVSAQIADALTGYVQKVTGKDLSSNDFTDELKTKLEGLDNYVDTELQNAISSINNRIDTLVGTSASEAIDTFNEIEAFLAGITDTQTLTGILNAMKAEITAAIPTKTSDITNDSGFITIESVPTKTSELTNDSDFATVSQLPTKTSQLENDSDFATVSQIPTKTSELTNDSGLAKTTDIPTKVSELQNDSGYLSEETDPTVPEWAKQPNKPTYTASEVGALSEVPQATDTALGGVKLGYEENGKNYPIQTDETGRAYVNVPWSGKETPTLSSAPTEDTLTYTDSLGNTVNFEVGQSCVYPSEANVDGWSISFLKAITAEGKAIWGSNDAADAAQKAATEALAAAQAARDAATSVGEATESANTAADNANAATSTLNALKEAIETAITNAEGATSSATQATERANTATSLANTAAENANNAATAANAAAASATSSSNAANQAEAERAEAERLRVAAETKRETDTANAISNTEAATEAANTATTNAENATASANEATTKATEATTNANTAADRANTAAERAEAITGSNQSDYAENDSSQTSYIKNRPEIPTFESVPDSTVVSYVNSEGNTINFRIGDECRVLEDGEYTFYKLYDLVNGVASWDMTGGGGAVLETNVYLQGANYYNDSVTIIKDGQIQ